MKRKLPNWQACAAGRAGLAYFLPAKEDWGMGAKRKEVLIVAESLVMGGVERSICSLIHAMDKEEYRIDVLLVERKGAFLAEVEAEATILPQLFQRTAKGCIRRALLSVQCRSEKSYLEKEKYRRRYYDSIFPSLKKRYDIAIGCHNGRTQAYVANKVDAEIKIIQNHSNYADSVSHMWVYPEIDRGLYAKVDYIVTVSESAKSALLAYFPEFERKIKVIHNMVDRRQIISKAEEYMPFEESGKIKLATVCRLGREKGLDMAVEAARLLKRKKYDFVWHIVGEGDYGEELEKRISKLGLRDVVKLAGGKSNPYPYMKNCDLYVQPSYSESWGLTVQEALILGKYVIATDIPAFREQIEEGRNGSLAKRSADGILDKIESAIRQPPAMEAGYEARENEIEKYYALFHKNNDGGR